MFSLLPKALASDPHLVSLFLTCAEQSSSPGSCRAQRRRSDIPEKSGSCAPFWFPLSFPRVVMLTVQRHSWAHHHRLTSWFAKQSRRKGQETEVGEPKYLSRTIHNPLLFSLKAPSFCRAQVQRGQGLYVVSPDTHQSERCVVHRKRSVNAWMNG